jgi:hypothetical protein
MIAPREYFAALERGDARIELVGAALLRRACGRAKHRAVDSARKGQAGESIDDLVQDYVAFLYSPEGRTQRLLLDSWKGITVSFARFLRRGRRRDKSIETQGGLYAELLFDKVRKVLRAEPRFSPVPPPRPARFHLSVPPAALERLDEDALSGRLPLLAAILDPVGEQSPEVVGRIELADQLALIFTLTANEPRTAYALCGSVWPTLNPRPEEARRFEPPPGNHPVPDVVDGLPGDTTSGIASGACRATGEPHVSGESPLEECIDELAFSFLKSLDPRCAHVAFCRWATAIGDRTRTHEEVSRMVGAPRSTVARDADTFVASLGEWVEKQNLDEQQSSQLLDVMWEILRAGDFHPWEGAEK